MLLGPIRSSHSIQAGTTSLRMALVVVLAVGLQPHVLEAVVVVVKLAVDGFIL